MIAWHGLARTGRDMDDVAEHLATHYRVMCPDTIGHGLSEWSPAPEREYCLAFYGRMALSLMDQLAVGTAHWLGTSMGGALGIHLAAGRLRGRVRRLILNDIGPSLGRAAVERIRAYAGCPPEFDRVSGCGHASTLNVPDQLAVSARFLAGADGGSRSGGAPRGDPRACPDGPSSRGSSTTPRRVGAESSGSRFRKLRRSSEMDTQAPGP